VVHFIDQLNPEQQRAVNIRKGPILILAGAGSGKTRVITCRIAHLIDKGLARPENILAITFTNKAADEMKSRVHKLVHNSKNIWIRTFHSTCAKILRDTLRHRPSAHKIVGVSERFTIYDEQDQYGVIKECLKELNLDVREFTPSLIANVINRMKQDLKTIDMIDNEIFRI
jgi:DNA helicase-2/ATP-dependent DNA helicase PcrA